VQSPTEITEAIISNPASRRQSVYSRQYQNTTHNSSNTISSAPYTTSESLASWHRRAEFFGQSGTISGFPTSSSVDETNGRRRQNRRLSFFGEKANSDEPSTIIDNSQDTNSNNGAYSLLFFQIDLIKLIFFNVLPF
jgi:hypothetical protein